MIKQKRNYFFAKKRILFLTISQEIGGAEVVLLSLLRQIDRSVFDVHVISLKGPGPIGGELSKLNIPVYAINLSVINFPLKLLSFFLLVKKISPDIIQTCLYRADFLGLLIGRILGAKIFWGVHTFDLKTIGTFRRIFVRLCGTLSYFTENIIFCSKAAINTHLSYGYKLEKSVYIPNGFDSKQYYFSSALRENFRAQHKIRDDDVVVGLAARFSSEKNHNGLIQAIKLVRSAVPQVKLVLCGRGISSTNKKMVGWLHDVDLQNQTFLLGELRGDALRAFYCGIDIFTLPSHAEAFPIVLGEAMLCERPCIATNVGDTKEILGDYGVLVPKRDTFKMADAIISLAEGAIGSRNQLGKNARQYIVDNFLIEDIVKKYEHLYV